MVSLRLHVLVPFAIHVVVCDAESRNAGSVTLHNRAALRGSSDDPTTAPEGSLHTEAASSVQSVLPEAQESVVERNAMIHALEPDPQVPPVVKERLAVWVTGFPRSGSSTTLSMVKSIADINDSMAPGQVFSLFEPCHEGDDYEPWLAKEGCSGLLSHVSKCDFGGVNRLWGWNQPHTTNNHTMTFSKDLASNLCSMSDVIALKTVDYGHDIRQFLWLLDRVPSMRIVATVRDPRGIYASWTTTEPFRSLLKKRELCGTCPGGEFYNMTQLCDAFAQNLHVQDHRVHTIVFEELVRRPVEMTRRLFDFLGVSFGSMQREWIKRTFDAADCPEEPSWHEGFADCHKKSAASAESWRSTLSAEERATFASYPPCLEVAEAYGYPLQ